MKQKLTVSKKVKNISIFFFLIVLLSVCWVIHENQHIQANELAIKCEYLPKDFSGYKIAHISDLHNAEFGDNNEQLLSLVKDVSPDIIVITGDIIDSRQTNVQVARDFIIKENGEFSNNSEIIKGYTTIIEECLLNPILKDSITKDIILTYFKTFFITRIKFL